MRKLLILSSLLFFVSCEEEVPSYNDLTPGERTAIENMGKDQCLAKSEANFNAFKTNSTAVFTSAVYNRGKGFKFELKNGSTILKTIEFSVWKQIATPSETAIYFLVNDSFSSAGNYFLKITKAQNDQIIDEMKTYYCDRSTTATLAAGTLTTSSLTMTYEKGNSFAEGTNTVYYADKYLMLFNELAQFATYRVTRTKKVYDQDNNQTGSTETHSSTLSAKDVTFAYTTPASYSTTYCQFPAGPYSFIKSKNFQGFYDPNVICSSTKPGDWNLTP